MTEKRLESNYVIKPLGELVPRDVVELTIGGMIEKFPVHHTQEVRGPDPKDPSKLILLSLLVFDNQGNQRCIRGDRVKVVGKVNS